MKFPLKILSLVCFWHVTSAQVLCIQCYDQNESLNPAANNLVLNGGFENFGPGNFFCPNSKLYNGDAYYWNCANGGSSTYADIVLQSPYGEWIVPEGTHAAYFGNSYCDACADHTHGCLTMNECTYTGLEEGYPINAPEFGDTLGVSLSQDISGLKAGSIYVCEFWAGGEAYGYTQSGLFALDLGFGKIYLSCPPTEYPDGIGKRYMVVFKATSSTHTVKFTNWGHIGNGATELELDDVRVYDVQEATATPATCYTFSDTIVDVSLCLGYGYSINGHNYTQSGTYHDTIVTDFTHFQMQQTNLTVTPCNFGIANAFTPNGDGTNDYFHLLEVPYNVAIKRITVYNRWGNAVFQTTDYTQSWDGTYGGTPEAVGVYVYVIDYMDLETQTAGQLKGNLSLLR